MAVKHKVKLDIRGNIMIATWCSENCNGEWFGTDQLQTWIFNLEGDAVAFKLRWI